jgi:hypothetical protein
MQPNFVMCHKRKHSYSLIARASLKKTRASARDLPLRPKSAYALSAMAARMLSRVSSGVLLSV